MKLIILLLSLNSFAEFLTETHFTIGEKKIIIFNYKEQRISISEKCESLKSNRFCENIEFLKVLPNSIKKANLPQGSGGMNPGSNICDHVLNGIILIGVDEKKNENSFCKLPSGIIIDSGTLTYYSKQ